jgi:uncharacterized protein
MPLDLAERVMYEALHHNGKERPTEFIWHGGEPLLAGLPFFKEVRRIQKNVFKEYKIENSLQTNGTLMKEDWIRFFLDEGFHIGVSLDGPEQIHDKNRVFSNGHGSFRLITENLFLSKQMGLQIGILSVLTKATIGHEEEIYQFFKDLGFNFDFSPVTTDSTTIAITPSEYAQSAIRFFNLWFSDSTPTISVRPPASLVAAALLDGFSGECTFTENCAEDYISIGADGSVFPCNRFAGRPDFVYGNINHEKLELILESGVRKRLISRSKSMFPECTSCPIQRFCNAGCPHQALEYNGSYFTRDYFCPAYQQFFPYVIGKVQEQLKQATVSDFPDRSLKINQMKGGKT